MKRFLYFLLGFASCIACLIFIFKKIDKFTSELVRRYNKFEGFFLDNFVLSIKTYIVALIYSLLYGYPVNLYPYGSPYKKKHIDRDYDKVTYYKPYYSTKDDENKEEDDDLE